MEGKSERELFQLQLDLAGPTSRQALTTATIRYPIIRRQPTFSCTVQNIIMYLFA